MARLIDADKLEQDLMDMSRNELMPDYSRQMCMSMAERVSKEPTIEAEPVRHSKWDENAVPFCNVCQECGAVVERHCVKRNGSLKRCPNCGAKMDSKEVEENDT